MIHTMNFSRCITVSVGILLNLLLFVFKSHGVEIQGPKSSIRRRMQRSVTIDVYIRFDDFPTEIGWSILNAATLENVVNYPMGTYPLTQRDIFQRVILSSRQSYIFTIRDDLDYGMSNPVTGYFHIKQGGFILVEAEGDLGAFESIPFTTLLGLSATDVSSPMQDITTESISVETFPPTASIFVNVTIDIVFDSNSSVTEWSIVDAATNKTIVGMPAGVVENISKTVTLSTGQEYNFSISNGLENETVSCCISIKCHTSYLHQYLINPSFPPSLSFVNVQCCVEIATYTIRQDGILLVNGSGTNFGNGRSIAFKPYYPRLEDSIDFTTTTSRPTISPSNRPTSSTTSAPVQIVSFNETSIDTIRSVEVIVHFVFDSFPQETGWSIYGPDNTTIMDVPTGTYPSSQTESFEMALLTAGTTYTFTLIDSFADGMSGGRFEVLQDGVLLVSGDGNSFLSSETFSFTTLTDTDMMTATMSPGTTASGGFATIPPSIEVGVDGVVTVTFELIFDGFPEEISWTLISDDYVEIASETYTTMAENSKQIFELEAGTNYTFLIRDSSGDGLCCTGGEFSWMQQGVELVKGGGDFGTEASFSFTTLGEKSMQSIPTKEPDFYTTENATAKPSFVSTFNATANTTDFFDPVNVTIFILLDAFPEEIGWSIVDKSTGDEIISIPIGSYPLSTEIGTESVTLMPETIYDFTILDWFGDGLTARGIPEFGSYIILQEVGNDTLTLFTGDPDFGHKETIQFSPLAL